MQPIFGLPNRVSYIHFSHLGLCSFPLIQGPRFSLGIPFKYKIHIILPDERGHGTPVSYQIPRRTTIHPRSCLPSYYPDVGDVDERELCVSC